MQMESGSIYERVARVLLYALIALLPVFFLPISLEPLELNKQTLLVLLTLGASLAWIGAMVSSRTLTIARGWFNLLPLLVLGTAIASAVFSRGAYVSWIGSSGQEYTSVLSVLAYVVLFYLTANLLRTPGSQRVAFACLLGSGAVAGTIGLLSLFGVHWLPGDLHNTVGTVSGFVVYLAVMAVFANALLLAHREEDALMFRGWRGAVQHLLMLVVSANALLALLIVDFGPAWITLLGGLLVLFVFAILRAGDFGATNRFFIPLLLVAVSTPFLFWLDSPFSLTFPSDVTPNVAMSSAVAKASLAGTSVLFGSGPGTFSYDYAQHRPASVNETAFWSVRFNRAANFALTLLPTLGILGAAAWALFLLASVGSASSTLIRERARKAWLPTFVIAPALVTLIISLFLYPANLTSLALLFLLSGFIGVSGMRHAFSRSFRQSPRLALAFALLFILLATGIVTVIFVTGQRYVAEAAFASAVRLNKQNGPIRDVVTALDRAASFNRYDDSYYRTLSQAFLVEAGEEIGNLNAGEEIPAEKRAFIQALTGAAVNASARATELAPNDVLNWETRGAIYREFIPLIGNAGEFSTAAYARAAELDPQNPAVVTDLGKTWFALAENNRTLTASKDKAVADAAKATVDGHLQKAEEQFLKAINLKADYAPAHFQLGLVYERQGKIPEAIGKMESVAEYNPLDVGVFFQLGLLYMRRGDPKDVDRAEGAFEAAIALSPSYANARWFLASIYEQKKDLDKAIEQVQKVLDLNPDNELVKARLERLKAGKTSAAIPAAISP